MTIENMGRIGFILILFGILGVLWAWNSNNGDLALMSIIGVVLGLALFIIALWARRTMDRMIEDNMEDEHGEH